MCPVVGGHKGVGITQERSNHELCSRTGALEQTGTAWQRLNDDVPNEESGHFRTAEDWCWCSSALLSGIMELHEILILSSRWSVSVCSGGLSLPCTTTPRLDVTRTAPSTAALHAWTILHTAMWLPRVSVLPGKRWRPITLGRVSPVVAGTAQGVLCWGVGYPSVPHRPWGLLLTTSHSPKIIRERVSFEHS